MAIRFFTSKNGERYGYADRGRFHVALVRELNNGLIVEVAHTSGGDLVHKGIGYNPHIDSEEVASFCEDESCVPFDFDFDTFHKDGGTIYS